MHSWGEIDPESLSDKTTVLSLSDLDNAFFTSPALESWWDSLRGTLVRIRTLLWVTHSRRDQNPHANMMVGLLRSAASEMPTSDVESLEFPSAEAI